MKKESNHIEGQLSQADVLKQALQDPEELRQAILLSEILRRKY